MLPKEGIYGLAQKCFQKSYPEHFEGNRFTEVEPYWKNNTGKFLTKGKLSDIWENFNTEMNKVRRSKSEKQK